MVGCNSSNNNKSIRWANNTDLFSVKEVKITIDVNTDLKTAEYLFEYHIIINKPEINYWKEIFIYPKSDLKIIEAEDQFGLDMSPNREVFDSRNDHTIITLTFPTDVSNLSEYKFYYRIITNIESVDNIVPIFGGNGCIWYWISHEFYVENIKVHFNMPKSLTLLKKHPEPIACCNHHVEFSDRSLIPYQLFTPLITYEKRLLGLKPKIVKTFAWIISILVSVIITTIISRIVQ